jgi:thioredoxin-related protein
MSCLSRCLCLTAIVACLLSARTGAQASQVTWQTDLQQALHEAGRSQKPLLVEFTASWCGYCRKMKQTTFADARIVKHVNGCFVPVSIDADENERLMQSVGVDALPTTVILSPQLQVVRRIAGYQTVEQFEQHLATVRGHEELTEFTAVTEPAALDGAPATEPSPAEAGGPVAEAFAFDRLCLVSLRDAHRLRTGDASHSIVHKGQRLCFASRAHRRRFERNPELYWPMLDGRCVVSRVDEDADRPGDARLALVFRGRVWLFADRERRERFFENAGDYAGRGLNQGRAE